MAILQLSRIDAILLISPAVFTLELQQLDEQILQAKYKLPYRIILYNLTRAFDSLSEPQPRLTFRFEASEILQAIYPACRAAMTTPEYM